MKYRVQYRSRTDQYHVQERYVSGGCGDRTKSWRDCQIPTGKKFLLLFPIHAKTVYDTKEEAQEQYEIMVQAYKVMPRDTLITGEESCLTTELR